MTSPPPDTAPHAGPAPSVSLSPDASLTAHDGLTPAEPAGLTYPLGARTPELGEVIPVSASTGWVRVPLPGGLGHINCWLIGGGEAGADPLTIVDTGMRLPMCREAWDALFAGPLAGRTIDRILCTHMHPDHVGLAGWLAERTGTMLWMTRGEFQSIRLATSDRRDAPPIEVSAMQHGAGWTEEQVAAASANGWARVGNIIHHLPYGYRRIVDGERLNLGGSSWQVVIGSGHSPEHACLLNEADGILISGDQVLPRISSNVSLSAAEPFANPLSDWLASIERLLLLDDDLLVCPAHGKPFRGLHARLKALRTEHHDRLDDLTNALAEAPRRAVDCFPLLFRRTIGDEHRGMATGETLAHLRWLEVAGRITRDTEDGVWWWRTA